MIFEPLLSVTRSVTNGLGRLDLNVQAMASSSRRIHSSTTAHCGPGYQDLSPILACKRGFITRLISFSATMKSASPAKTS